MERMGGGSSFRRYICALELKLYVRRQTVASRVSGLELIQILNRATERLDED
jgi:hypothetical protein